jgi:hypothetical protein
MDNILNKEIKLSPLEKRIMKGKVCPYCHAKTQYVDSIAIYGKSYGMIYWCKPCDAYCGVHKDTPKKALGRIANAELREWKKKAHAAFDPLWKSSYMNRHRAYKWLSDTLGIPPQYTHIGMFGVETCKKVVELSLKEIQ